MAVVMCLQLLAHQSSFSYAQAARLRYMWTTPVVLATDVELSEEQRQQLVNDHQQRTRDILQKACGGALKLIMQHKVRVVGCLLC